ncbi:MAG: NapC/NirT family cytochrome c [Calditrichaceae bacterium]|nr:NapC/NirT family cytochrome c [Calditrichaceae bacterium]
MFDKYVRFIKNISINAYGKAGVILTTSSFLVFLVFELARMTGILTNAYIGLITYLLFPLMFVIGLILIPIGWYKRLKSTGKTTRQLLQQQFDDNELKESFFGSKLSLKIGLLTLVNILFLLFASTQMLSFMDEPYFCGTACHSVMNPEWVTYQQSPHARVKCVECHVGEGTDALIASKLNGMWQMISITFNLYERPIPTPVHQLRPARETCEKCHWPDKFYGDRLRKIVRYQHDEKNTPVYSTLLLKIDSGKKGEKAGIHWHVAAENEVRYVSVNDKREEMIWVEVRQADQTYKRYFNNTLLEAEKIETSDPRILDCMDCHNRATHIYQDPEKAIDERIQAGFISAGLPFIKREGLRAISINYNDQNTGLIGIATHINNFYRRNSPLISTSQMPEIDRAIYELQQIYQRNIHPHMNISWGSYASFIGHDHNSGCFRCHNNHMISNDGEYISYDCTTCHSILAMEEMQPLKYLEPVEEKTRGAEMHRYLQEEFKKYYRK